MIRSMRVPRQRLAVYILHLQEKPQRLFVIIDGLPLLAQTRVGLADSEERPSFTVAASRRPDIPRGLIENLYSFLVGAQSIVDCADIQIREARLQRRIPQDLEGLLE